MPLGQVQPVQRRDVPQKQGCRGKQLQGHPADPMATRAIEPDRLILNPIHQTPELNTWAAFPKPCEWRYLRAEAWTNGGFLQMLRLRCGFCVSRLSARREDILPPRVVSCRGRRDRRGRVRWPGGIPMPTDLLPAPRQPSIARNKGCTIGQKRPLMPRHVWSIRVRLEMATHVTSHCSTWPSTENYAVATL